MSPKHKRGRERKGGMSKTDLARELGDLETPLKGMKGVPPAKLAPENSPVDIHF